MLRKYGGGRVVSSNRNCHMRAHQTELTVAWDGIPKAEYASMSLGSLTCTSLDSAMAVIFHGLLSWSLLSTGQSVISQKMICYFFIQCHVMQSSLILATQPLPLTSTQSDRNQMCHRIKYNLSQSNGKRTQQSTMRTLQLSSFQSPLYISTSYRGLLSLLSLKKYLRSPLLPQSSDFISHMIQFNYFL